jgi:hypothetical protein
MQDVSQDNNAEPPAFFRLASCVSSDKPFVGGQGAASRGSSDFSFMKKRVRVNAVDRHVKEYLLDQEEREAKKQKGKKKY